MGGRRGAKPSPIATLGAFWHTKTVTMNTRQYIDRNPFFRDYLNYKYIRATNQPFETLELHLNIMHCLERAKEHRKFGIWINE